MHFGKSILLCIAGNFIVQYTFLLVASVGRAPKSLKTWTTKTYDRIRPLKEKVKKKSYVLTGDLPDSKSSKKAFEAEKAFLKQLIIEALASFKIEEKQLIKHVSKKHVLSGQIASSESKNKDLDKKRKKGEKHDAQ